MGNPYFQFKSFTIQQDQCAMKVCTDACVLGAWFAGKVDRYGSILDIGSGTGLLMMMLAQQTEGDIHGIEIDLAAYRQLQQNISQNEWRERLRAFPGDVRNFHFPQRYDFIISNPPFFENDLLSASENNQVARHSRQLSFAELLQSIERNLQPYGSFGVLLPQHRWTEFDELARTRGFHLTEKLFVQQSVAHAAFRAVLHYGRRPNSHVPAFTISILDEEGKYTPEFSEMLRPYYLKL